MQYIKLNTLVESQLKEELRKCCGSSRWVDSMADLFPIATSEVLLNNALSIWYNDCGVEDWLEAFTHHPKIGEVEDLAKKFPDTAHFSASEQNAISNSSGNILQELARANKEYEDHFGFIFIVSAAGKSAEEMLGLLRSRLKNDRNDEIRCARTEQCKITIKRLKKLLGMDEKDIPGGSHLTTHVLDTSSGKPAFGIPVQLFRNKKGDGCLMAQGRTDEDGRVSDLLPPGFHLKNGNYIVRFQTEEYFQKQKVTGFYPEVNIHFTVFDQSHYHVPLLVSPFGYSTYRGS